MTRISVATLKNIFMKFSACFCCLLLNFISDNFVTPSTKLYISIPKLNNSFEPAADQYPHYSLEALDAPFKGLLVNSGMYLPTGLYIAPIDNPWGTSVEEWEKEFWRSFSDNACTEYNSSF